MQLLWHEDAWDDYCYLQSVDKKMVKRINELLKDIRRHPYEGIGKPEPLKNNLSGWWSRRIDNGNRIVYRQYDENTVFIAACKNHY